MQADRALLAASSDLTLVDDTLAEEGGGFEVSVAAPRRARSPVRVMFHLDEPYSSVRLDSGLTSAEASSDHSEPRKRSRALPDPRAADVTPKPAVKVQKVSNSSKVVRLLRGLTPTSKVKAKRDVSPSTTVVSSVTAVASSVTAVASSVTAVFTSHAPSRSSGSTITVQQLLSEFRLSEAPSAGSLSSSSTGGSLQAAAGWRPELLHELSSKDLVGERDSGVNVVAKIDVLPFMGTSECEWESRAAGTWSFRLLRARLRLLLRLAHRSGNSTRACVRADTPVTLAVVQHADIQHGRDDPLAALCLCLAAETLQRLARGVTRAGGVPALLRRCAGVTRVALRWSRAMRDARAQLAFTLADDGLLSLKVANVRLRSVWEVTLRVELAGGGEDGCAWPRAADVRVTRVVAAWAPSDDDVRRLLAPLPADWGHVPRTVWKIFKYLKHKRPEVDLLLGA